MRMVIPDVPRQEASEKLDKVLTNVGYRPPHIDGTGCIMHISDTPSSTYRHINFLLSRFKPSWLIHTGDVADELKLEMYPNLEVQYSKQIQRLARYVDENETECYVTAGNHDDADVLEQYFGQHHVIRQARTLELGGVCVRVAHSYRQIADNPGQINLYGHDMSFESQETDNRIYLNGLDCIRLINLSTMEITCIRYPWGTDDERLLKRRMGL